MKKLIVVLVLLLVASACAFSTVYFGPMVSMMEDYVVGGYEYDLAGFEAGVGFPGHYYLVGLNNEETREEFKKNNLFLQPVFYAKVYAKIVDTRFFTMGLGVSGLLRTKFNEESAGSMGVLIWGPSIDLRFDLTRKINLCISASCPIPSITYQWNTLPAPEENPLLPVLPLMTQSFFAIADQILKVGVNIGF